MKKLTAWLIDALLIIGVAWAAVTISKVPAQLDRIEADVQAVKELFE